MSISSNRGRGVLALEEPARPAAFIGNNLRGFLKTCGQLRQKPRAVPAPVIAHSCGGLQLKLVHHDECRLQVNRDSRRVQRDERLRKHDIVCAELTANGYVQIEW